MFNDIWRDFREVSKVEGVLRSWRYVHARHTAVLIFLQTVLEIVKCKRLIYHSGGAFPFTVGRIEHGFNVRPDLCAVDNDINPRKYLGKFWTDSLVHDAQALDLLVKVIGEVMSKTVKSSHSTVIAYHIPLISHACSTDV